MRELFYFNNYSQAVPIPYALIRIYEKENADPRSRSKSETLIPVGTFLSRVPAVRVPETAETGAMIGDVPGLAQDTLQTHDISTNNRDGKIP